MAEAVKSFLMSVAIIAAIALAAFLSVMLGRSWAMDNGQYEGVDPNIRAWFKSVRSPHGVPCCDIADGYRLNSSQWDIDAKVVSGYKVLIEGEWRDVPIEALVSNVGNPLGEAVVWYVRQGPDSVYIRCFVPGGGV